MVKRSLAAVVCGLVCLAWPALSLAQSPIRGLRAERFDVNLTLLPDGSVDVRETVIFRFTEKTFSEVERVLSMDRRDGIIDVRASLDGRPLPEGRGDDQVRLQPGRRSLRVTWQFPKTIDQSRTFTLEYRAMNVLATTNGRAEFEWTVLPSRHRYGIDQARVEWRVPVEAIRVEPTMLDDPRWTSGALSDGWMATRDGIGVNETVVLRDGFQASTLALAVPAWQTHADRARQMAPSFIVGAMTLLVMAAGVVGMTRFRYPPQKIDRAVILPAAADSLAPALGTAVAGGTAGAGMPQMQATLLDLVRRGIVEIREVAVGKKNYTLTMSAAQGLRPHEQVLTDALWLQMKQGTIDLAKARGHLVKAIPAFRRAVASELRAAGFVDAERAAAAKGMRTAGVVVTVLGIAGMVIFGVVFGHLGDLPLLVPGAVVASGILFLIAGLTMPVLSQSGAVAAAAWRARKRVLRTAARTPADLEPWWAVAAGFGLAGTLAKAGGGPAWLSHLSDSSSAMTAILIATTVHSSVGGGGGGVGGAGGSSSAH
ncbi:MAG: DUF2207 domain-containing protein [Acidobacteria bacterium]|nr:DUF2207 domain-containing protein [Acidobacteriota bacterium]